jgi:LCP family protein required for cell wall assembly
MNMFKNKFFWITLIFVLLAFLAGMVFAYFRPLSKQLDLNLIPTHTTDPAATPVPAPAVSQGACGQTGVSTTLFMARDLSEGTSPPGADTIRFIRMDYDQKRVTILAVPRDLWVKTPVLAAQDIAYSRLGLVFYHIEEATIGEKDDKNLAAIIAVAQTLYDNFQPIPNHYLFFEMTYFASGIDQLGGLDVNIPTPISFDEISFSAGLQHLNGEQALLYARLLPGNELSDGWNRLDRQNLVLDALHSKIMEPINFFKIPGLVSLFWDDILTDLSPSQVSNMICMLTEVPSENIKLIEVDPSMITGPGPDSSMIPDVEKVKKFMLEQLAP